MEFFKLYINDILVINQTSPPIYTSHMMLYQGDLITAEWCSASNYLKTVVCISNRDLYNIAARLSISSNTLELHIDPIEPNITIGSSIIKKEKLAKLKQSELGSILYGD